MKSVMVDWLIAAGLKPASIVSYNHLGNNDGKNLLLQNNSDQKKSVNQMLLMIWLLPIQFFTKKENILIMLLSLNMFHMLATANVQWTNTLLKFSCMAETPSQCTTLVKILFLLLQLFLT